MLMDLRKIKSGWFPEMTNLIENMYRTNPCLGDHLEFAFNKQPSSSVSSQKRFRMTDLLLYLIRNGLDRKTTPDRF